MPSRAPLDLDNQRPPNKNYPRPLPPSPHLPSPYPHNLRSSAFSYLHHTRLAGHPLHIATPRHLPALPPSCALGSSPNTPEEHHTPAPNSSHRLLATNRPLERCNRLSSSAHWDMVETPCWPCSYGLGLGSIGVGGGMNRLTLCSVRFGVKGHGPGG